MTVAVNLSPARDSLLVSVSFKRIFKFVPIGTIGFGSGLGAVLFRLGFLV
jgi:hypothetical protein